MKWELASYIFSPAYVIIGYLFIFIQLSLFTSLGKFTRFLFNRSGMHDGDESIFYKFAYRAFDFLFGIIYITAFLLSILLPVYAVATLMVTEHYLIYFFIFNIVFFIPFLNLPKSEGAMIFIPK